MGTAKRAKIKRDAGYGYGSVTLECSVYAEWMSCPSGERSSCLAAEEGPRRSAGRSARRRLALPVTTDNELMRLKKLYPSFEV
jgi:hypothetical protein